jgi:putative membrane protein
MTEQLAAVALVGAMAWYARGIDRLWTAAGRGRIVGRAQVVAYAGAMAVLLLALEPPLDAAVDTNLTWHMVQHVLLLAVAPPLLAASAPVTAWMYALPSRTRMRVQPLWRRVLRSQEHEHWLTWTAGAFALANFTLGIWHLPSMYDASLDHPALHVLEHTSFVATATLFWWMVLGAGRRERRGLGVLGVFVASLPATALGVLMTMSSTSWYAGYGTSAAAVRNQQVAGAVMWGFGGLALVVGAAALFAGWLAAMDRDDERARARTVTGRC